MEKIIVSITIVMLSLTICTCSITGIIVQKGVSFLNSLEDWKQNKGNWNEVEIPVSQYEGKIVFIAEAAHPLLAEYYYKLRISQGDQVKEIDLPMNTGGQVDEQFYLITYEDQIFLETGETIIDLQKINTVTGFTNELTWHEHEDDITYYNLRIKGYKQPVGEVTWDKGLVFSSDIDFNSLNDFEEIIWDDWFDLSNNKGKLRIGVGKDNSIPYLDSYIEISNNKESMIFEVSNAFDRYIFTIKEYQYESYTYIVMGDRINEIFNVESLIEIRNDSVSGFLDNKEQEELWVKSLYLSKILKKGKKVDIGIARYDPQNPQLETTL